MKSITPIALILGVLTTHAYAIPTTVVDDNNNRLTADFVKKHVDQSMSIGRAIKSIVGNYPREAIGVVSTALDLYPEKYKEIIHAAISAEPALTGEVVSLAIEKGISSCSSIVETAINAEPSYVDFIVRAAAFSTPDEMDEIVRIAVETEPDSADNIVQTLSRSHPNEMVEIIKTAVSAMPFVGEYVVDALLASFPDEAEQVVTTALRESAEEQESVRRILVTAMNAGVPAEDLLKYAKNAGATEEQLAFIKKQ
ncbi:hypothetical protein Q4574_12430 [Aliiglaciecola sp. 3_MG-2023]|uniref:hypothetical protein n=1 Tax=Aliiglaciecola sp. 3_MG-2023 TaxID=3062644 RepID=UPI0026E3FDB8|nr:hypothetical protein [Aliiglaciecola sp. 3_MG-2023]MDO6694090.1 hypothetical protein [Aliiglaciecola sp. 3_MG-2023]